MVHTLLAHLGMVAPDAPNLVAPPKNPAIVRAAIIPSEFGKGRVLGISPHPESSETLRPLVFRGIRWAAGGHH